MSIQITPQPNDEEAVAISAAIEFGWPRPVIAANSQSSDRPGWRFSGRWWAQPSVTRRARPWK